MVEPVGSTGRSAAGVATGVPRCRVTLRTIQNNNSPCANNPLSDIPRHARRARRIDRRSYVSTCTAARDQDAGDLR
eukprot:780759-Prymnesium_polylepis.1